MGRLMLEQTLNTVNQSFIVRVPAQLIDYSSYLLENGDLQHKQNRNSNLIQPCTTKFLSGSRQNGKGTPQDQTRSQLEKSQHHKSPPKNQTSHVNPFMQGNTFTNNRLKQYHINLYNDNLLSQKSNRSLQERSGSRNHSPKSEKSYTDSLDNDSGRGDGGGISPSRNQQLSIALNHSKHQQLMDNSNKMKGAQKKMPFSHFSPKVQEQLKVKLQSVSPRHGQTHVPIKIGQ